MLVVYTQHRRKMDKMHDEINLDVDQLHARLMRAWLYRPGLGQQELARRIGLSEFAFRGFVSRKKKKFTLPTKIKLLAWIEKSEKEYKEVKNESIRST